MKTALRLLRLEWLATFRSPVLHKKLLVNIFMGFTFLYLAANFLALGFLLDDILMEIDVAGIDHKTFPGDWVLRKLNRYLIYYFLVDFIARYFMQKLPALSIQPLLHLPVKKSYLVNFMLLKTVLSPFNLFQFLILGPFMGEVFENLDSPIAAWSWVLGIIAVIFAGNFVAIYLKRTADIDWRVYALLLAVLASIAGLTYFEIVDFTAISGRLFNLLVDYPVSMLAAFGALALACFVNFKFLKNNLYLSKITKADNREVKYEGSGFLSQFGLVGKLTELEFKFIWRNKRSRSVLLMGILFLFYGLFVFTQDEVADQVLIQILFSIIVTGMFTISYGQYLLGWDGSHFDHILTRRVSFEDYYLSKFFVFAIVGTVSLFLSIPYVYFGWNILLTLAAVALFNLGIGTHIVMFFGSFNPKKVDLKAGNMMNWQGVGAAQFLLVIPSLGLPVGVYALFSLFMSSQIAIISVGLMGIAGLLGTKLWVKMLAGWLRSKRYEIASDFRN